MRKQSSYDGDCKLSIVADIRSIVAELDDLKLKVVMLSRLRNRRVSEPRTNQARL